MLFSQLLMPYQIRNFWFQKDQNILIKSNILDLYVYKANNTYVGVKFRNAQQKKYGYKIQHVQVKVYDQQTKNNKISNKHLQLFQNWKKYQIDFQYKLFLPYFYQNKNLFEKQIIKQNQREEKMKQKQSNEIKQKQNLTICKLQSFQSQLSDMNRQLKKSIQEYFKDKQGRYQKIFEWIQLKHPILQIFQIRKDKYKLPKYEKGILSVNPLNNRLSSKKQQYNNLIFNTLCLQNKKRQVIQNSIQHSNKDQLDSSFHKIYNKNIDHDGKLKFLWNCSYPQLLQDIYNEYIAKQAKF